MSHTAEHNLLRWAFLAALSLHLAALAVAACLPGTPLNGAALFEEIRVFAQEAPALVSPVEVVEWPLAPEAESQSGVELPVLPPPSRPQPAPPPETAARPTRPTPGPSRSAVPTEAPGASRPAGDRPIGGGGAVGLGATSDRGDLPLPAGGATTRGMVPGEGPGSGSGEGPGSGPAAEPGDGSQPPGQGGPGFGAGTTRGDSHGSGSAGRAGQKQTEPAFTSRVADRAEPQLVRKVAPAYPPSAVEDGVEGTVKLKVVVSETGAVAEVEVVASSGDRRLDQAAKECVRGWRYRPAVQDGKPRRVPTYATVEFELR